MSIFFDAKQLTAATFKNIRW